MLSILRNRKTIVSILTMVFLIIGVQGMSYAQDQTPATAPDLELSNLILPTGPVNAGASFAISVTVMNSGDAATTTSTTVIFFRDADNDDIIDSGDEIVGVGSVSPLDAVDETDPTSVVVDQETVTISSSAPSDAVTHYYGAYVIPVAGEDVTNNYMASSSITVVNPPQPNLQVINLYSDPSFYDPITRSYTVPPNVRFTLTATVRNDGTGPFTDSTLAFQYYDSNLQTLSASPNWKTAGTVQITPPIATGSSGQVPVIITLPALAYSPYPYYYRVRVAPADGVSDQADNLDIWIPITTASADLAVDTPTVDKSAVGPGESFTLTTTVRNLGTGLSGAATLQYYRSTDSTFDINDITTNAKVGTEATIGPLSGSNPSNTISQTVSLTAPTTPGNLLLWGLRNKRHHQ